MPLDGGSPDGHFNIEGRPQDSGAADANFSVVSPGYLATLRIPVLRGRDLSESEHGNAPVTVISAEMARLFFPGQNPIGKRIWFDSFAPQKQWLTIVGIAADIREEGLTRPIMPVDVRQPHANGVAATITR